MMECPVRLAERANRQHCLYCNRYGHTSMVCRVRRKHEENIRKNQRTRRVSPPGPKGANRVPVLGPGRGRFPPRPHGCLRCGIAIAKEALLCGKCISRPPPSRRRGPMDPGNPRPVNRCVDCQIPIVRMESRCSSCQRQAQAAARRIDQSDRNPAEQRVRNVHQCTNCSTWCPTANEACWECQEMNRPLDSSSEELRCTGYCVGC